MSPCPLTGFLAPMESSQLATDCRSLPGVAPLGSESVWHSMVHQCFKKNHVRNVPELPWKGMFWRIPYFWTRPQSFHLSFCGISKAWWAALDFSDQRRRMLHWVQVLQKVHCLFSTDKLKMFSGRGLLNFCFISVCRIDIWNYLTTCLDWQSNRWFEGWFKHVFFWFTSASGIAKVWTVGGSGLEQDRKHVSFHG